MDAEHVAMEVVQSRGRGGAPETLLAIYCVDQKDYIFQTADYWVMQVPSCLPCYPKMNITFCKRTESKTPEIAEQLELLGEPWVQHAVWHRVLCLPIPPEVDYNLANFCAIGVGSNCIKRERASKLALALTVAVYQPLNARYRPEEQLFQRLTTRAEAILPRRHPLLWPTTTNALAVPYFERRGDFSMRTYQAEWLHDDRVVRAQGDLYDAVMNMMETEDRKQAVTKQWKQAGQAARAVAEAKDLMGRRNTNLWRQAADDGDTIPGNVRATYDTVDHYISKLQWMAHRVLDEHSVVTAYASSAQQEQPQTSQPPPLPLMPAGFGLLTQPVSFGPAEHGAAQPEQWQLSQPPPVTNHGGCMATKEVPTYASLPYTGVEH